MDDSHKFPFSLFTAIKQSPGVCKIERSGGVYENIFNKTIGRSILQIKGSVSANNFIEYSNLSLNGNYLYIMYHVVKNEIGTLHFEIETREGLSLRITISTLYDSIRFLGRSLRMPLPSSSNWMILCVDIQSVLTKYCASGTNSNLSFKSIKKLQICSNLSIKDCITSDTPLTNNSKMLPKELCLKPSSEVVVEWVCLPTDENSPTEPQVVVFSSPTSLQKPDKSSVVEPETVEKPKLKRFAVPRSIEMRSKSVNRLDSIQKNFAFGSSFDGTGKLVSEVKAPAPGSRSPLRALQTNDVDAKAQSTHPRSRSAARKITISTPMSTLTGSVFKVKEPETSESDKCLVLDSILHYCGGPARLVEDGGMVLYASGPTIVLTDLYPSAGHNARREQGTGLWGAFRSNGADSSKKQALLHGHSAPVGIIEVSASWKYLVTCEKGPNGLLIVWSLLSSGGRKIVAFRAHKEGTTTVAVNSNDGLLCTTGLDAYRRVQIIIWDLNAMIRDKIGVAPPSPSKVPIIVAKQISDFDIAHLVFSPHVDDSLVSCGRENIRFWRIKKGCLPGRPVLLNEYSRGYNFSHLSFVPPSENQETTTVPQSSKGTVFVASNKGVLLRVDCALEQVICAYQLHSGAITSLAVMLGFAVTGGSDCKLRLWPLDFSDYLLEAVHDSDIACAQSAKDGTHFIIGTSWGTLGVLDATQHSYSTILRSHTKRINAVISNSSSNGEEVSTVSSDGSIRVWDAVTMEQKCEFNSPTDEPLTAAFHPKVRSLVVGFRSGAVRVFDLHTTTLSHELIHNDASCLKLLYTSCGSTLFAMFSDGDMEIFDTTTSYTLVRTVTVLDKTLSSNADASFYMAVNSSDALLACSSDVISSLVVLDVKTKHILFRVSLAPQLPTTPLYHPQGAGSGEGSPPIVATQPVVSKESSELLKSLLLIGDIVGVCFVNDGDSSRDHILLASSKYLISIPVADSSLSSDALSARPLDSHQVLWGDRSLRRVEFGSPKSLYKGPSGLLCMTVRAPTGSGNFEEGGPPNAIALFTLKLKSKPHSARSVIAVSAAQLYKQNEGCGSLTGLATCPSSHKLIASDDNGALYVWHINAGKMSKFLPDSPPDFGTPVTKDPLRRELVSDLATAQKEVIHNLTSDFETAMLENPHLWSTESKKGAEIATTVDPLDVDEFGDTHIVESETYKLALNFDTEGATEDDDVVVTESVDLTQTRPDRASAEESLHQDMLDISSPELPDDSDADSEVDHLANALPYDSIMSPLASVSKGLQPKPFGGYSLLKSAYISNVELLAHRATMHPQYSHDSRSLLTSDGSSLYLRDLSTSTGTFLVTAGAVVVETIFDISISPCGKYVIALGGIKEHAQRVAYACVHSLIWSRDEVGVWSFLGGVMLPEGARSHHMDWTCNGDFVLFSRLDSAHGIATIKTVPRAKMSDKPAFAASLTKSEVSLSIRGEIERCKVVNRVVSTLGGDAKIYILVWGGGRIQLILVDSQSNTASIVWTEYVGSKGKYLTADISALSIAVPEPLDDTSSLVVPLKTALLMSIDTFGLETVRCTVFRFSSDGCESKSFSAHMSGAYAFGTPRVLCLSPCGTTVAVGHNSCIRFFSVGVSQEGQPFSISLTAILKVSIGFTPEYLWAVPVDTIAREFPIRSNVSVKKAGPPHLMVAASDGTLGYIASKTDSCLVLRSPPLHSKSKGSMHGLSPAKLLTIRQNGKLLFYHSDTGVQLPSPFGQTDMNTCSAVTFASDGSMLAVGSFSGRVSVYSVPQMYTIKLIESPSRYHSTTVGVIKMVFVHSNQGLVVSYSDGNIYMFDLNKNVSEQTAKLVFSAGAADDSILCQTYQEDKYWALLLPKTSEIIIYKVYSAPGRSKKGFPTEDGFDLCNVKLWSCVIMDKVTVNKFDTGKRAHETGAALCDARLFPSDDGFIVKCLYSSPDYGKREMFLGTILAERRKVYEVEITSKEVLMKYGTHLDVFIDYVFTDDVLVVSTTNSISIYSINKRRFNSSSGLVIASMKMSDCINGQVDLSKILMSASVVPSGNEDKADENTLQVYIMTLARPTLLRMEVKMKEVDGGGAVDYE